MFTRTMRQLICQMDEWDGLTMEDIRRMEDEVKAKLDEMINSDQVSSVYGKGCPITRRMKECAASVEQ